MRDVGKRPPTGDEPGDWYVRVEGDSMAPEFFDGDHLPIENSGFVDIRCTNPQYPKETIHQVEPRAIRLLGKVRLREKDQLVGAFTAKIVEG